MMPTIMASLLHWRTHSAWTNTLFCYLLRTNHQTALLSAFDLAEARGNLVFHPIQYVFGASCSSNFSLNSCLDSMALALGFYIQRTLARAGKGTSLTHLRKATLLIT